MARAAEARQARARSRRLELGEMVGLIAVVVVASAGQLGAEEVAEATGTCPPHASSTATGHSPTIGGERICACACCEAPEAGWLACLLLRSWLAGCWAVLELEEAACLPPCSPVVRVRDGVMAGAAAKWLSYSPLWCLQGDCSATAGAVRARLWLAVAPASGAAAGDGERREGAASAADGVLVEDRLQGACACSLPC